MMAQQADAHIGLRLPEEIKRKWTEEAEREHRSLSNWIVYKIEAQEGQRDPTREDRRRGRKSTV